MNLTITSLDAPLGAEVSGYDFAAPPMQSPPPNC